MKINIDKFEKLIADTLNAMFGLKLFLADKSGLIRKNGGIYEITDKSAYIYHYLEQAYTKAYIDKMWYVLRNEAFPDKIILK